MNDTWTLIEAMKAAYGPDAGEPREADSLRSLEELVGRWLETGAGEEALENSLAPLASEVGRQAENARTALATGQGLAPGLVLLGRRAASAWSALQGIMDRLGAAFRARDVDSVASELQRLATEREEVQAALEGLAAWQADPVPRCPACGHASETWCETCGLMTLVPDPQPEEDGGEFVALGPSFLVLYHACEQVATGRGSLDGLSRALLAVDGEFAAVQFLALSAASLPGRPPEVEAVLHLVEAAREGLQQMAAFLSTRALADLNRGWARMTDATAHLQSRMAHLGALLEDEPAAA